MFASSWNDAHSHTRTIKGLSAGIVLNVNASWGVQQRRHSNLGQSRVSGWELSLLGIPTAGCERSSDLRRLNIQSKRPRWKGRLWCYSSAFGTMWNKGLLPLVLDLCAKIRSEILHRPQLIWMPPDGGVFCSLGLRSRGLLTTSLLGLLRDRQELQCHFRRQNAIPTSLD